MKSILLAGIACLVVYPLIAQEEISRSVTGNSHAYSFLSGAVETSTTAAINTHTADSNLVQVYVAPSLDFYHSSGLGLKAKSYAFTGGSDPGFFLTSLSAYYATYSKKVHPFLSYSRYIDHQNPSVPYSPIQNDLYGHIRVKTKPLTFTGGIDYGFGNDKENNNEIVSDITVFSGISRIFKYDFKNSHSSLAFIPSVTLNAGTDRYFKYTPSSKYISQNRTVKGLAYGNGQGRGNGNQQNETNSVFTSVVTPANNFGLSNLEVTIYSVLFIGRFTIEPSGSLYIPLRSNYDISGYWMVTAGIYLD